MWSPVGGSSDLSNFMVRYKIPDKPSQNIYLFSFFKRWDNIKIPENNEI